MKFGLNYNYIIGVYPRSLIKEHKTISKLPQRRLLVIGTENFLGWPGGELAGAACPKVKEPELGAPPNEV
jgi:hypothetical protein